jgi:signal peptidase I
MTKKTGFRKEATELIAAFIIAWIVYHALAFVIGTSMPIVSVVSDSMYHTSHFDQWWTENEQHYVQYNITKEQFQNFSSPNGLSRGDLLLVVRADEPEKGDILIYNKLGSTFTIVHRLVGAGEEAYIIKGDHNIQADAPVLKEYVVGKVLFAVPLLGYPRLALHAIGV